MAGLKTLYDEDFAAWSKQQAEALRAAARGGSKQQLDWENLAEEIERLGSLSGRPRQSYHADHPGSGEASAFAGYRSAQQLAQIDPTGSDPNPQSVAG